MKWIGQHIWDFVSRFRNDVYFENLQGSAETTALVVDGDGKVTTNSLSGGGNGEAGILRLQVRYGEAVTKGCPVYVSGYHGSVGPVIMSKADASNASHMPAFGVADADYAANATGYAISLGNLIDINTSSYSVGDTLYVAAGGGLTNVKPATEANLVQNVATVSRSNANNGQLEVTATGRANDTPNLDENAIFLGDSNDKATQVDAPMISVVKAADAAAARTVLSVDVSGTDNSTNVTLAGEDYLSLSGQQITANDIDLTDNVTGVLPIANGGTGSSTQKIIQIFPMNFLDDLGTTKHYMPFVTNIEQTVNYQEEAAMVMPADGRVVSVTVHMAQMHNNDGNITIGIETSPCGQSYANAWTIEETEVIAATQTDDHHVFHFGFDNAKHFDSTDKLAISIQQSADMQSANRFFWVSTVIEYDWSTFLGGTSAEYTTTP